jgi:predicted MFS family arabinose efflux permease
MRGKSDTPNAKSQTTRLRLLLPVGIMALGAASLIGSAGMGARQTFGLFVEPVSITTGISITTIALAIAIHNLVWGIAQPFAGAAADRYGPGLVVAVGAGCLFVGLGLAAIASSSAVLILGIGVFFGIGISCTSFGVVTTAIGKLALPENRCSAMGLASAGGSLGQVMLVPLAQDVLYGWGPAAAFFALALLALLVAPFGYFLVARQDRGTAPAIEAGITTRAAVVQALHHDGFWLLTFGFFTCGFQLAFVVTHLPTYLNLCGMAPSAGALALALIGLFNMVGSWGCGWLGGRYRQRTVLAVLYALRGAVIIAFFLAPASQASIIAFSATMGLMWLGTVPLTTGLVARLFGIRHLGTLFGICFLSHQIGSFAGSWLGGVVLQATGSYDPIWIATAAAGFFAAALHLGIRDEPVATTVQPA